MADHPTRADTPTGRLAAAWTALLWEDGLPRLWPVLAVIGLFVLAGLLDLLPRLGPWGHAIALLAFAGAFGWSLWRAGRGLRLPGPWRAARRLEADSALAHRPVSDPDPALPAAAADDPLAQALWARETARRRNDRQRARAAGPKPVLARVDPVGLRLMLILAVGIAAVQAGGDWRDRLGRAVNPALAMGGPAVPAILDLYVTPPDYTGRAPIYLQATLGAGEEEATRRTLSVPTGSTVIARLSGSDATAPPDLRIGASRQAFTQAGADGWEAEATVTAGNLIGVEQSNRLLVDWPITVIEDMAPAIDFVGDPGASRSDALAFEWAASDNYGVAEIDLTIRLDASAPDALAGEPVVLEIRPGPARSGDIQGSEFFDLTPHPWAGQPVILRLAARDALGQEGQSRGVTMLLPERRFTHPIAQAVAEQRKLLLTDPAAAGVVGETLAVLAIRPDRYGEDPVVFLALRTTARRLAMARDPAAEGMAPPPDTVSAVAEILWNTALRIEDGDLSLAERRLREARDALAEALEEGASGEEIAERLEEVQAALDDYLRARAQAAMEAMAQQGDQELAEIPPGLMDRMLSPDRLQEMLEEIGEMAETGATDAARRMLDELDRMLENLGEPMIAGQQQQGEMSQAMELIRDLEALMRAQQALQDQTFRDSQESQPGGQPQPGQPGQSPDGQPQAGQSPADAATQEALRRALGELMRQMGEMTGDIPAPLGDAEQSMRQAEGALGNGQPGEAVDPQGQALDSLAQGLEGLVNQMMEGMAGQPGMMPGQQGPGQQGPGQPRFGQGPGQDPLGRDVPNGVGADRRDLDLPSERAVRRAREILDELRRRAADRDRPEPELDYIDRLLDRF